jgi:hypothetical protein
VLVLAVHLGGFGVGKTRVSLLPVLGALLEIDQSWAESLHSGERNSGVGRQAITTSRQGKIMLIDSDNYI